MILVDSSVWIEYFKGISQSFFSITKLDLDINWLHIIKTQTINLQKGLNKIGIPDLIIAQNTIENNLDVYTLDNYFSSMSKILGFTLYKV